MDPHINKQIYGSCSGTSRWYASDIFTLTISKGSFVSKTRDLESQLAKEMKARLQHENRVAAALAKPSSSFAFSYQNPIVWTQKKAATWTLQVEASIEGHN
ncbi:hypothetical protein IFM89_036563 [Coptis chinensis]|uniref:Uncharacterized protein n=1 Tax=Coptis chinensis TaxID=261450 RepID=A0A835HHD6_9MAGN|nr:hypothetical protein IFM89_036563 [Coptis chinensis]